MIYNQGYETNYYTISTFELEKIIIFEANQCEQKSYLFNVSHAVLFSKLLHIVIFTILTIIPNILV